MVAWDKHRRILKDWQWNVMNEIISGKKTLNDRLAWGCKQNLKTLKTTRFHRRIIFQTLSTILCK